MSLETNTASLTQQQLLERIAELEAKLAQRVPDWLKWPTMPKSRGQSDVMFDDGYEEGWSRCLEECHQMLAAVPAAPEQQEPEDAQSAFERWAERVCPSGDVTEVQRQWEASSDLAEWLESQRTEDVLIDGVAYTVPTEVACELLRLHMIAQASNAQQAEAQEPDDGALLKALNAIKPMDRTKLFEMAVPLTQEEIAEAESDRAIPKAWANFTEGGNIRIWSKNPETVEWAGLPLAPLFTRPQPAQRPPLTIAEVEAIIARWSYELHGDRARFIVRETELAHGIG